ncbi:MAG: insulinase family protein, partial [Anaerolineales bacterium]|nr:insulinase family protein [Anaerolineales bacterium]
VGGLFDPDEKMGLADFVASSLMRGTVHRDFQAIYDALESVGASFGFRGRTRTVGFGGRSLAEDFSLLLRILSESLRQPVFPAEQVERLRAQLLTGLAMRAQDTDDMASLTFDQIAYAEHPYRRPEDGYPETIQAITRADLLAFHRQHYGPKGMVLAVVGALDPQTMVAQVRDALGDWENPSQPDLPALPPLKTLTETVRKHHVIAGKSQADIILGVAGPQRKDAHYIAASLGNSVLGQFGMMGRIGDVVRERSGLAYYAYSSLSAGVGPGAWYVSAGVNPASVEKVIALITLELERFVEQGVSPEELLDSQTNYIGRLPLSLESNGGVAGALLNIERYDLGLDYYRRYADLVRAVTPEDVLAAARNYLDPQKLVVVSAGPKLT